MTAEQKKGKKVIPMPPPADPMEKEILIPSREVEAVMNAIASGNWNAAVDIVNAKIRPMAQEQNPQIFKK